MNKLIGTNFRRTDNPEKVRGVGFAREYHDWALDIGYAPSGTDCQHQLARYRWNPSYDGATPVRFDALYQSFGQQVCPVLTGASPFKLGFGVYPGHSALENKPVCAGQTAYAFSNPQTLLWEIGAYKEFAEWATLYAARYGADQAVASDPQYRAFITGKIAPSEQQAAAWGQQSVRYLEIWNEQDKNWMFPLDQFRFTPEQYAALLSAVYDGHGKSWPFQVAQGALFSHLGVKNVDKNMKIVMGGLSGLRGCYIEKMIQWCKTHRPTLSLPFDVVNFHHYNNDYFLQPSKTPAYVWDYFCQSNYTSGEIQLGAKGVCPERAGFKERLQYAITRLIQADSRMRDKEFWLSETGYDTHVYSPQSSLVPGVDPYEAQAQWLTRVCLEISAAVVDLGGGKKKGFDRLMLYDIADANTRSGGLFQTSGIYTDIFNGSSPKTAYYYIETLKNALNEMRFDQDASVLNNQLNPGKTARVYAYKAANGYDFALAAWSPTQENLRLDAYRVYFPAGIEPPLLVFVTTMQEPAVKGVTRLLQTRYDPVSGRKYVQFDAASGIQLSERPVFIASKGDAGYTPAYQMSVTETYCNAVRIALKKPNAVAYDPYVKVYYAEGSHASFPSSARLYSDKVPENAADIYIGDLKPNTFYTFWIFPSLNGRSNPALPGISAFTEYAEDRSIKITPDMTDRCGASLYSSAEPFRLFDEPWLDLCAPVAGKPLTSWQPYKDEGQVCVRFKQAQTIDAFYFYAASGMGQMEVKYRDASGSEMPLAPAFQFQSGVHGRWFHFSNFAKGLGIVELIIKVQGKGLNIGEVKLFGEAYNVSPAPLVKFVGIETGLHTATVAYEFSNHFEGALARIYVIHAGLCASAHSHTGYKTEQEIKQNGGVLAYTGPAAPYQLLYFGGFQADRGYTLYLVSQAAGKTYVMPLAICTLPDNPPPDKGACPCEPLDLSDYAVSWFGAAPVVAPGDKMLGDACADGLSKEPKSMTDEQSKWIKYYKSVCADASGKNDPPASSCDAATPLSEWFPGWTVSYPRTIRIAMTGGVKRVNKLYLFDVGGSGGLVSIDTEDALGNIRSWGEYRTGQWKKWVLAIDDPVGRDVKAIYINRFSAQARIAEIGLCGAKQGGVGD